MFESLEFPFDNFYTEKLPENGLASDSEFEQSEVEEVKSEPELVKKQAPALNQKQVVATAKQVKDLNERVTELFETEDEPTATDNLTDGKTDAVAKNVFRHMRRYFVDDFTAKYGRNKDRWDPTKWELKVREYLAAELQIERPNAKTLAKAILLLRSVQVKNNEKTSPVVKRHLPQIRGVFRDLFETGNMVLVRNFLCDPLGRQLYENFLSTRAY